MLKTVFNKLRLTVADLNHRWTMVGATIIILLLILSVVANVFQILFAIPLNTTVEIPVTIIILIVIIGLAAFVSIAIQLSASIEVVKKSTGITPVTNVFIDRRQGILHFGNIRNVLMRLETIQEVFMSVLKMNNDQELSQRKLYDIGFQVGSDFANDFDDLPVVTNGKRKNLEEYIEDWCEYDVEAGWGSFTYEKGKSEATGTITVRYNFLASPPNEDDDEWEKKSISTCSFMEGYISGIIRVFSVLLNPHVSNWVVEVKEKSCGLTSKNHSCRFDFEIKKETVLNHES